MYESFSLFSINVLYIGLHIGESESLFRNYVVIPVSTYATSTSGADCDNNQFFFKQ